MDDLSEAFASQQEIDDAFQIGHDQINKEDESELEKELDAIVAEQTAAVPHEEPPQIAPVQVSELEDAMQLLSLLPSVPSRPIPSTTTTTTKHTEPSSLLAS